MKKLSLILGSGLLLILAFLIMSGEPPAAENETAQLVLTPAISNTPATSVGSITPRQTDSNLISVLKVIDGDTIVADIKGTQTTIRLMGIDTPETVDPRKPVQCFGKEASARATALLTGQRVKLEYEPTQKIDKYGRTLAYVFLPDGRHVNKLLIEEGYAHEYTYSLPYQYQTEFKSAQQLAETNQAGLWAPGACTASSPTKSAVPSSNFIPGKQYVCGSNSYNCDDFATQAEAQYVFGLCGGTGNDVHRLDRDSDGRVCESLP